ncbi:hypothetical protein ACVWW2_002000 [Bradyrhizobium sp. LM4.3]
MILRLVARQRHQPGLGLSRDRWLLAWSRTIVEGRQRGRRPAPARHSVAPSDDRPKSMAHCAERRIFPIRQQHLRPRHPARQFDPRPPKCCQGRNLFIAHCPFDRSPPSCHDTAPRCADRKRGIRQQPVRSTNQPAPGAQASWNRSSRSCAGKRLFCGGGARPPCLSDDRLHWRSSWGAGGRADPRSCRAPLRPTMPIEPSCQRAPGGTRRRRSRFGASSIRTSPCTECARSGASSSAEIFHIARSTVSPLMRDNGFARNPLRQARQGHDTSTASSSRHDRMPFGTPTSPISRPGPAPSTSPLSSTPMLEGSWAGGPSARQAPASCSMRWSRSCGGRYVAGARAP